MVTADGYIPKGALSGGTSRVRYYIRRVRYRKGVHPGNIREGGHCKFGLNGRSYTNPRYQLLTWRY